MAKVRLNNVAKTYPNGFKAIHGIDVDIADGEFIVLVGPSGCGKSTLMRMIAGLESVTEGSISIGEREVNNLEPADRDIAMVFQNYALYPHMNVFDNMAYGLKIRRVAATEIQNRVNKAAEILELTADQLTRKPRELSGGQRQRVAMGRAIVREPSVFLFDEPLSNLDAKLRVQMRIEIKLLQQQLGTTSVYVTHDQVEAMTLGHRLVVLNQGRVEQLGTPIELYERPSSLFVAGFIGSPAMNFAPATINADASSVDLDGGVAFELPEGAFSDYCNQQVILGIRPEDLALAGGEDSSRMLVTRLVEHLGADTLVHGHFGQNQTDMTIRLAGIQDFQIDQALALHIEPDKIHLFDSHTEQRLG
ncbi:MAG: Glycerol-3-phosphate ABC transporter, ATP-binding protein UgpC (TC 3.A.1.1.3) [Olavius algarvensis Gamma 3 endosymbiont]|nr:MAG: Glycerol-3-phosphate ABC transporter, ATP-binding protein UgpC (TC 3.A.1.1.3) [Olavius algarvensis Gamma 3 endosymbiont]